MGDDVVVLRELLAVFRVDPRVSPADAEDARSLMAALAEFDTVTYSEDF